MKSFVKEYVFNERKFDDIDSKELNAVLVLQRAYRNRFYKFETRHLIDRLVVEVNFISTSIRYYLFLLLFVSVMFMLFSVYDGYAGTVSRQVWQQFPDASDRRSFVEQYASVVSSTHLTRFTLNSINFDSPTTLPTRHDWEGLTIFGKVLPSSNLSLVTSACLEWTRNGVQLDSEFLSIPFDLNLVESNSVALVLTKNRVRVYSNGLSVGEAEYMGGLQSCLVDALRTDVLGKWSAYDVAYGEEEIREYFDPFGLPQQFLLTATVPGTFKVDGGGVLGPFFFISSGVIERKNSSEFTMNELVVVNSTENGILWASRIVQPFLSISEGDSRLGVLEVIFDEEGFGSSGIFFYPKSNSSLLFWFILNIVLTMIIGYNDSRYISIYKLKNHFVLIPNLVFSIFFYIFFHSSKESEIVSNLVDNAAKSSVVLQIVNDDIIAKHLTSKTLAYFGGMFVLYLIVWRLVACMRVHPRVALFVNTMVAAHSEILHFLITFFIVISGLAMIGIFTFGYTNDIFTSFGGAVYEMFLVMLGDNWDGIDNWRDTRLGIVYYVIVPIFLCFNLINFLLAIVIDTYVKIREETVEKNNSHQPIWIEIWNIPKSALLYWAFDFSHRMALIQHLEGFGPKVITMKHMKRLFRKMDENKIKKFCQFYHQFDFLKITKKNPKTRRHGWIDVDAEQADTDVDLQFQVISKELNELLVGLHLRTNSKEKDDRTKIIEDYQAARTIDRLTKTQVRSRKLREYFKKAQKDAEHIESRTSSGRNIFQSLLRGSEPVSKTNSIKRSFVKRASTSVLGKQI